ncbi:MAG: hypothetical protein K5872_13230 [Rhizobiaceae bacterium]|nr:hypothetical protein [Rhizobiaceae bacterium]MCV0407182.1 hypothetical protein [Rhizobiaceae bacterium]
MTTGFVHDGPGDRASGFRAWWPRAGNAVGHDVPKHERIWFARGEAKCLHAMPSAARPAVATGRRWRPRGSLRRRLLKFGLMAVFVPVVLVSALYLAAVNGVGSDRARIQAEALITTLAGQDIDAVFGPAGVSLDPSRFLALKLDGLKLAAGETGAEILEAGLIKFGVRLKPLLSGEIRIGSARIANARIIPHAAAADGPGRDWAAGLSNELGLIDPDLVVEAIYAGLNRSFDALDVQATDSIELEDVEIVLGPRAPVRSISLVEATLTRSVEGRLDIEAVIAAAGRTFEVSGKAIRAKGERRIHSLDVTMRSEPGRDDDTAGTVAVDIAGSEGTEDVSSTLDIGLEVVGFDVKVGDNDGDRLAGRIAVDARAETGTDKVELSRVELVTGRSRFVFNGAAGPAPADWSGSERPSYRYELVSNGSTLSPLGSREPSLKFMARLAGSFYPDRRELVASEIGIRTGLGEVAGDGLVTFGGEGSPGIRLSLTVPRMPVGQVKQIWPWFAATGARNWVHDNIYGGMVSDSTLSLDLRQGRLGNGIPLGPEEVEGQFRIAGARFDVAGRMPPVRDAVGTVHFAGSDVDIALDRGTVYLADGKTVEAHDGTFLVGRATGNPAIGRLDIAVAGDADAVTRFANYEPISALRQLELKPDDFSGEVEGRVKADVPLRRDIPVSSLDWLVEMTYRDLAVAQPFEGQMVTDAAGSIRIDPMAVELSGDAKLNGVPATLKIVQPLGGSAVQPVRDIALVLDDAARDRLLPGLSDLLSGPATVKVTRGDKPGEQLVTADLTKSVVRLPWAGWSKGAGVEAAASFAMTTTDKSISLTDFALTGPTFAARGTVDIQNGALTRARFSEARLNKNDNTTVSIDRSGSGYSVTIRGERFDARPLVKHYLSDSNGPATKPSGEAVPVTVQAEVVALGGFSGETLSGTTLSYSGVGSRVDRLDIDATTASGAAVEIGNATENGRRTVTMRSADAGAILRFLDIYENMQGGRISVALAGGADGALRGQVEARDFWIVDEPRIKSLVSSTQTEDAGGRQINSSRAQFERGFSQIEKGPGYLRIGNGVVRGPQIGATFQGTFYDPDGRMDMTGTFMPAYGINRIFGEIPLFGQILGNGRDRGLIGITFRLAGDAKQPHLQVNPLSAIAPGIFRQIFEFN